MENSDAPGTDGPAGFGYVGDSAGGPGAAAAANMDHNYRSVAREINQGILDGHNTQLDHPPPVGKIHLGGTTIGFAVGDNKRLSPTRSKYFQRISI